MDPLVLNVKEAAAYLSISPWTLRRYADEGLIPVLRLPSPKHPGEYSRRVLFHRDDLDGWAARQPRTAAIPNPALSAAGRRARAPKARGEAVAS